MQDLGAWTFRGYLPHYNATASLQLITFRLAGSLPRAVHAKLAELALSSLDARIKIERYLDTHHGAALLGKSCHASTVEEALTHFHGVRYYLHAWVIMPNHVHVLIEPLPGNTTGRVVQSWKSFTAREIAKRERVFFEKQKRIWQPDYFDRYIRNESHYASAVRYIHENPVKAGLVVHALEWRWSSAARWRSLVERRD
jgi:REP element-mobilizing transposase RayT